MFYETLINPGRFYFSDINYLAIYLLISAAIFSSLFFFFLIFTCSLSINFFSTKYHFSFDSPLYGIPGVTFLSPDQRFYTFAFLFRRFFFHPNLPLILRSGLPAALPIIYLNFSISSPPLAFPKFICFLFFSPFWASLHICFHFRATTFTALASHLAAINFTASGLFMF